MSLDTYANLKTELATWLDRDDLTDNIDTFIDIAEARHRREIRTRAMLVHDVAFTIAINARYVAFPADFVDIKHLRIIIPTVTTGRRYYPDLDYVTTAEMSDRSSNNLYRPSSYTVHTQIEFDTEPDQAYVGEMFYYAKLTALDGSNTTNSLLDDNPDAYLYGALAASAPFLLHDERVQLWETLYADVRDRLNAAEIENKMPGPLVSKIQNVPRAVPH